MKREGLRQALALGVSFGVGANGAKKGSPIRRALKVDTLREHSLSKTQRRQGCEGLLLIAGEARTTLRGFVSQPSIGGARLQFCVCSTAHLKGI
jgi:hypothetical protein